MMMGDKSSIFASGARRSERKVARAMAADCSDSPGIDFSSRTTDGFSAGSAVAAGPAGAAAFIPAVNCPV